MNNLVRKQAAIDAMCDACSDWCDEGVCKKVSAIQKLPPNDYAELKREFIRMASYVDSLLVCSDEQKKTLIGFISRLAEHMPWTERD